MARNAPERMESLSEAHAAFGKQIRRVRLDQKLSQEDLGHRAGLHATYIGDVERGERNLSLTNILKVAAALNTPAAEFVDAAEKAS